MYFNSTPQILESLWLWIVGESDQGADPTQEQGLLNGWKKISEFIVSAVVVAEGCKRTTHASLCLKGKYKYIFNTYFYKYIDLFVA